MSFGRTLRSVSLTLTMGGLLTIPADAATCTAIASGNWTASSTWSCGRAPLAGDLLIIPAGLTVTISANLQYSGTATRVKIYGTLFFNGGGSKLRLACGSIVEIMTPSAMINGNSSGASQQIAICGTEYWRVANGPQFGYLAWPSTPLPVELISWQAEPVGRSVRLEWSTASEQNSSHFEIMRIGPTGDERSIATVHAAGNSQIRIDYSVVDDVPATGHWIYRLLEHGLDGSTANLGAFSVDVRWGTDAFCSPVPTAGTILVSDVEEGAVLVVHDPMGKPMLRTIVTGRSATIDLQNMPNGTYTVTLEHLGIRRQQRIVVAH